MPYIALYVTPEGKAHIESCGCTTEEFVRYCERVVQHHFNECLNEDLVAGTTVLADPVKEDTTAPTSLVVVITAWYSPERERDKQELEFRMTYALKSYIFNQSGTRCDISLRIVLMR